MPAATAPIAVTLYGRNGCHLCDEAAAALARIGKRIPLAVTAVYIESGDDALLQRYMFEIPVICVDGAEIARAPISEAELEAELAALPGAGPKKQ
ncbi:MAG: glutaredoxin family protein [Tepidiformaceae bacterium]